MDRRRSKWSGDAAVEIGRIISMYPIPNHACECYKQSAVEASFRSSDISAGSYGNEGASSAVKLYVARHIYRGA